MDSEPSSPKLSEKGEQGNQIAGRLTRLDDPPIGYSAAMTLTMIDRMLIELRVKVLVKGFIVVSANAFRLIWASM